mgnify:CR=1 FL=1|jgi:hypothetical protein
MKWTDEQKAEVIARYLDAEPTPENSMEIVAELAEEFEKTPNGVRLILSSANAYVKTGAKSGGTASSAASSDKPKRVSKADAIAELTSAIEDAGQPLDEEILSKLTGKAAQYFTSVLRGTGTSED